jgi:asparagine synthase (glutamine-hydrolysing)
MCGISGFVSSKPLTEERIKYIRSISESLHHRGPDSSGEWRASNVILAHRRLAILDPNSTGSQPIISRSGRWVLILNGEIVNYLELRKEIGGVWKGTGDAETLVEALDSWGLNAIPRLNGMFAFAAWDNQTRRLLLVRDRLGIKPLFYSQDNDGSLIFSSTASSLASFQGNKINLDGLSCVLALGFPKRGSTLFSGIKELMPAHYSIWKNNFSAKANLNFTRYWNLPLPEHTIQTQEKIDEKFQETMSSVLEQWARTDVPATILLSSGLDSTAIATGLTKIGQKFRGLTIKMPDANMDESSFAARTAEQLGIPHQILDIKNLNPLENLENIVLHSDLPVVDSSQVGTWILSREAALHSKVVFTGDGADEIFAGYPTHQANHLINGPYGGLFKSISKLLSNTVPATPYGEGAPGWRHKINRFLKFAQYGLPQASFRWRTLVNSNLFPELFQISLKDPWSLFLSNTSSFDGASPLDQSLLVEVENLLPQGEIPRLDRMSMAHGLEARPPFTDHRMVEFALRLPFKNKFSWVKGGKLPLSRWLKKNLTGWKRLPKKGFNHPVQGWFQGALGEQLRAEINMGNSLNMRPEGVEKLLSIHQSRKADYSFELWTVLFLLMWTRIHKVTL